MNEKFFSYKYNHGGDAYRSPKRKALCFALAIIALGMNFLFFPFAIPLFIIPAIAWFAAPTMIYIGPRYLICNSTIMYFAEITHTTPFDDAMSTGLFVATGQHGRKLAIERDRFPSNARKDHKIRAHREKKFAKLANRIALAAQAARLGDDARPIVQPSPKPSAAGAARHPLYKASPKP